MADRRLAKYGVAYVLNFELYEIDGIDLKVDAADGGTDCTIRKNQAADTTATNDFVDEGLSYSLTITATEMQAKEVIVHIIDTATKAYLDKVIVIETYGNASALHAMDFNDSVRGGLTALPNAAADGAGGLVTSDAGGLDMDTKLANTNEITVARMGALTDWINGGRLDLLLDAIPTTAMRGTDAAATAANLAIVDTVVDAIKAVTDLLPNAGALTTIGADTARLTAARAAILTDWINGGRLDLLLDAIPTTAMRGTDGANTTVPDTAGVVPALLPAALVGGRIDADIGAKTGNVALSAQEKLDVNTEALDVIATDTHAEPGQGTPAATTSLIEKINFLYKAWRNKKESNATTINLYNDAGAVVDQKRTQSDDATTYTKEEMITGP